MAQTITLSASEIKNNPSVIAQANEYFKNLVAKCEKRTLPNIVMTIAEVGAENIFYVSRDYHGRYEDDDCTFTYWDNVNGQFIYDEWSTRFAAPSFFLYEENIIGFENAKEAGLVNMKLFTDLKVKNACEAIDRMQVNNFIEDIVPTYPRIKVEGGRKWKGNGYLVAKVIEESSFGTRVFAKVLSTEDFQIHYCNYTYVQYVDAEDFLNEYKIYAKEFIKNHPPVDMSKSMFATGLTTFTEWVKENKTNNIDYLLATAPDAEQEERNRKLAAKRAENFQNIVEWVKNNTDKTTDKEIMELALRILKKRY